MNQSLHDLELKNMFVSAVWKSLDFLFMMILRNEITFCEIFCVAFVITSTLISEPYMSKLLKCIEWNSA